MPATSAIQIRASDLESMCTLSAPSIETLEPELLGLLLNNVSASDVIDSIHNNSYVGSVGSTTMYAKGLTSNETNAFDIFSSSRLTSKTDTSVLVTGVNYTEEPISYSSVTQNIGGSEPYGVNKTARIMANTTSNYDSNVSFSFLDNPGPFYLDGYNDYTLTPEVNRDEQPGYWSIKFEPNTSANYNLMKAVNSQFCTTDNSNPLYLQEFADFNTNYAMGQDTKNYFMLEDGEDGLAKPVAYALSDEHNINKNGFTVTKSDFSNFDTTQTGTYLIQTTGTISVVALANDFDMDTRTVVPASQQPLSTTIKSYSGWLEAIQQDLGLTVDKSKPLGLTVIDGDYVNQTGAVYRTGRNGKLALDNSQPVSQTPINMVGYMPLFNSTVGLSRNDATTLPTSFSLANWQSLFDPAVDNPLPDYKYRMVVSENFNSGYSFDSLSLVTNSNYYNQIFELDNRNLSDNPMYMKDLVDKVHKVTLSGGTLSLYPAENGTVDNFGNLFILDARERLPKSYASTNGSFAIYTHSSSSRAENFVHMAPPGTGVIISDNEKLTVSVFYNNEDEFERSGISSELKTNSYVNYSAQLVYKAATSYNTKFKQSNGATLNFYSDGVGLINENVNQIDIGFVVDSGYQAQEVEIFKVSTNVNLSNSTTLLRKLDAAGLNTQAIPNVNAYASIINLRNINASGQTLEYLTSAKINFGNKSLDSLSLYNQCQENGWGLASTSQDKLLSSSISAYAPDAQTWPTLETAISLLSGTTSGIDYTITNHIGSIGTTQTTSANNTMMSDILTVDWIEDEQPKSIALYYDNENLTRANYTTISVSNDAPLQPHQYILPSSLLNKNLQLIKITTTRSYSLVAKDVRLRAYHGLSLTTPTITSTSTEFNLVDTVKGITYPKSLLKKVTVTPSSPVSDFSAMQTSVNQVTLSGTLTAEDLKDLNMQVIATDTEQQIDRALTEVVSISSMYGIESTYELNDMYEKAHTIGDIKLTINFDSIDTLGVEAPLNYDSGYGYTMQLGGAYEFNYTVNHFSSSAADLLNNESTNLSGYNDNYLTPDNAYSGILDWDTTWWVEQAINGSTTTLHLRNSTYTIGSIQFFNNTFLGSTAIIAFGTQDVFKVTRRVGNTPDENDSSQWFLATNYPTTTEGKGNVALEDGVYLDRANGESALDMSTLQTPGYKFVFDLKPDEFVVDMVGSVEESSLYPLTYDSVAPQVVEGSAGLQFQYNMDGDYSRILQLTQYRGYSGSGFQYYQIIRTSLSASFDILDDGWVLLAGQSFDVYAGWSGYVDNLSSDYGNIGLGLTFLYSSLSESDSRSYPIYNQGDMVEVTITNPNLTDDVVTIRKSLKNFEVYTFSGPDFAGTGGPLIISPSRLKLSSGEYQRTNVEYAIDVYTGYANILYDPTYLGNPALKPGSVTDPTDRIMNWGAPEFIEETSLDYFKIKDEGLMVNGYKVKSNAYFSAPSISFFVMTPPFIIVRQRAVDAVDTIPYNPDANPENNVTVYMPVLGYNKFRTYNPFGDVAYSLLDGTTKNVTFDSDKVNNITLRDSSYKTAFEYSTSANPFPRSFVVEGNFATIQLNLGLSTESNQVVAETLFHSAPSTRLAFIGSQTDNAKHMWKDSYSDAIYPAKDGTLLNIRQQLSSVYGSTDNDLLATNAAILPANITLDFGNLFMTKNFALDINAGEGLRAYYYSTDIKFDDDGAGTIQVAKYSSPMNIDFNTNGNPIANLQTSILFNKRETLTVAIPTQFVSSSDNTVLNLTNYLSKINVRDVIYNNPSLWENDTTYSGLDYVQVVGYCRKSVATVVPKIFVAQNDESYKALLVTKNPVMSVLGKTGDHVLKIYSDGTIFTRLMSTNTVVLNKNRNDVKNIMTGAAYTNYLAINSVDGFSFSG